MFVLTVLMSFIHEVNGMSATGNTGMKTTADPVSPESVYVI